MSFSGVSRFFGVSLIGTALVLVICFFAAGCGNSSRHGSTVAAVSSAAPVSGSPAPVVVIPTPAPTPSVTVTLLPAGTTSPREVAAAGVSVLRLYIEANQNDVRVKNLRVRFSHSVWLASSYGWKWSNNSLTNLLGFLNGAQSSISGQDQLIESLGLVDPIVMLKTGEVAELYVMVDLQNMVGMRFTSELVEIEVEVNGNAEVINLSGISETVLIEALPDVGHFAVTNQNSTTIAAVMSGTASATVMEVESRELGRNQFTDITRITLRRVNMSDDAPLTLVDAYGVLLAYGIDQLNWNGGDHLVEFNISRGGLRLFQNDRLRWRVLADLSGNAQSLLQYEVFQIGTTNFNEQMLYGGGIIDLSTGQPFVFILQVGSTLTINPVNLADGQVTSFDGQNYVELELTNYGVGPVELLQLNGQFSSNWPNLVGDVYVRLRGTPVSGPHPLTFVPQPSFLFVPGTTIAPGQTVVLAVELTSVLHSLPGDWLQFTANTLVTDQGTFALNMAGPVYTQN